MKELTIEEKAKVYDEALERARAINNGEDVDVKAGTTICEYIFPELAESEDERIRKSLIDMLKNDEKCYLKEIAWLEKQQKPADNSEVDQHSLPVSDDSGLPTFNENIYHPCTEKAYEQNHTDKAEPKFHKGDWIINSQGTLRHIINVDKEGYQTDGGWLSHNTYEKTFHLWSIQDAKDGDVLVCESGWTCIFKKLNHNSRGEILFDSYCFIDRTGWFCDGAKGCTLNERINGKIYPATKEQGDLLFAKMKEAGYEWDAKKKELKKIEQKYSEWSEEELDSITAAINNLEYLKNNYVYHQMGLEPAITFLKSLKDRVQPQPKQEWSEKDERIKNNLLSELTNLSVRKLIEKETEKKYANWLKSLRPQLKWRPSDAQMEALNGINVTGGVSYAGQAPELINLYNDLKKLRGGE